MARWLIEQAGVNPAPRDGDFFNRAPTILADRARSALGGALGRRAVTAILAKRARLANSWCIEILLHDSFPRMDVPRNIAPMCPADFPKCIGQCHQNAGIRRAMSAAILGEEFRSLPVQFRPLQAKIGLKASVRLISSPSTRAYSPRSGPSGTRCRRVREACGEGG